jgi:protein SCO1
MNPNPDARLRWTAAALAMSIVAAIAFSWWVERRPVGPVVTTGVANIDGRFSLKDISGRMLTERDFRGKTLVIYFGWTLDPDLTPAALQVLAASVDRLGPKSDKFATVFISLDPERDTTDAIAKFLNKTAHKGAGLVGMPDDVVPLARAFKLYQKRIAEPSLPGGYSIEHASLYYVFGVDGAFRGTVPHTTDVQELTNELLRLQ